MTNKNETKKAEEILLRVGTEIAKKKEGALMVISDNCNYKLLRHQKIQPFSLFERGAEKMLENLAVVDGAVIVNTHGIVVDYGAMIKAKNVFPGYGTRHSAAYSASLFKNTTAILVSEEEQNIKVFRKGELIEKRDLSGRKDQKSER